ncbi:MAG: hypothetical protein ACLPN6_16810, partial [Streptosporangiaceae bacterium]
RAHGRLDCRSGLPARAAVTDESNTVELGDDELIEAVMGRLGRLGRRLRGHEVATLICGG